MPRTVLRLDRFPPPPQKKGVKDVKAPNSQWIKTFQEFTFWAVCEISLKFSASYTHYCEKPLMVSSISANSLTFQDLLALEIDAPVHPSRVQWNDCLAISLRSEDRWLGPWKVPST